MTHRRSLHDAVPRKQLAEVEAYFYQITSKSQSVFYTVSVPTTVQFSGDLPAHVICFARAAIPFFAGEPTHVHDIFSTF